MSSFSCSTFVAIPVILKGIVQSLAMLGAVDKSLLEG